MSRFIKVDEFDAQDFKNAYDLVMNKEKNDAKRGILFVRKIKEDNKFNALIVKDQVDYHYYIVDRGNGIEIYDYDFINEKTLDLAYISKETQHGRTLIADAIKDFYVMYFNAIAK